MDGKLVYYFVGCWLVLLLSPAPFTTTPHQPASQFSAWNRAHRNSRGLGICPPTYRFPVRLDVRFRRSHSRKQKKHKQESSFAFRRTLTKIVPAIKQKAAEGPTATAAWASPIKTHISKCTPTKCLSDMKNENGFTKCLAVYTGATYLHGLWRVYTRTASHSHASMRVDEPGYVSGVWCGAVLAFECVVYLFYVYITI